MTDNLVARYERSIHSMQTGVKMELNRDLAEHGANLEYFIKHLRVGNNARACDHAALVRILIAKGLFTEEEYCAALADEMDREVERYRQKLNMPANVSLG